MSHMRAEQRETTRTQIVTAALLAISESGFDGASTRSIAERAGVSQGLLTYHFRSKEMLWRAAADHLFALADEWMQKKLPSAHENIDTEEKQRKMIRQAVHFNAAHPEMMRFMMEYGKEGDKRTNWLVETHIRPRYLRFAKIMGDIPKRDVPHAFYVFVAACGAIFCIPNECKRLTGLDSRSKSAVKRHANYLANLMVPRADECV